MSLDHLYLPVKGKSARVSSYDKTGGNGDAWSIAPGENRVLAEIEGPGKIVHFWTTIFSRWGLEDTRPCDPLTLRKVVLRFYWDDETEPSVEVPLGDFFGLGHARAYTYQCAFFSCSANPPIEGLESSRIAMNCWLPMPFHKKARVEMENQQELAVGMYFYVDYQYDLDLPQDTEYLHAVWHRSNPCKAVKSDVSKGVNLSDENNYLIVEAEGKGKYIGANFSIDNLEGGWWGEGDDMFFLDRDGSRTWPPDLHGTGSEDYLSHAWGMQMTDHLYCGQPWAECKSQPGESNPYHAVGKVCCYRYHAADPVLFNKNLRLSIEHGHANDKADDWASTAYWYQTEPHRHQPPLAPVEARLPGPSHVKLVQAKLALKKAEEALKNSAAVGDMPQ